MQISLQIVTTVVVLGTAKIFHIITFPDFKLSIIRKVKKKKKKKKKRRVDSYGMMGVVVFLIKVTCSYQRTNMGTLHS